MHDIVITAIYAQFLTLCRTKETQTPLVVRQWPCESLDTDSLSGTREESEERLENVSELSTVPLITQTHDCWQRHTDEAQSKAAGTLHHNQSCL